jgi:hypothetical protein
LHYWLQNARASTSNKYSLDVCGVSHLPFVVFAVSSIWNPESLLSSSNMFHTILTMYKASLLYYIHIFSNFHIKKPTVLLSFSNVNEQRKKREMQTLLKINIMVSKAILDMLLKKRRRKCKTDLNPVACTTGKHAAS